MIESKKYNAVITLLLVSLGIRWFAHVGIDAVSPDSNFLLSILWILKSFAYLPLGIWGYQDAKGFEINRGVVFAYLTCFGNMGLLTYLFIRFLIDSKRARRDQPNVS